MSELSLRDKIANIIHNHELDGIQGNYVSGLDTADKVLALVDADKRTSGLVTNTGKELSVQEALELPKMLLEGRAKWKGNWFGLAGELLEPSHILLPSGERVTVKP